jgi:methionyl-tRNA synthetase
MEQLYSEAAGKFLADRFVSGTCPKCGYEVRALSQRRMTVCFAAAYVCTFI